MASHHNDSHSRKRLQHSVLGGLLGGAIGGLLVGTLIGINKVQIPYPYGNELIGIFIGLIIGAIAGYRMGFVEHVERPKEAMMGLGIFGTPFVGSFMELLGRTVVGAGAGFFVGAMIDHAANLKQIWLVGTLLFAILASLLNTFSSFYGVDK